MLPSRQRTRSAPRNLTRFAAQYLARGLPCERFTAALASRTSCITQGRGGWLDLPRGGLSPPILCQLSWRTLHRVRLGRADHLPGTRIHGGSSPVSGPIWGDPIEAALGQELPLKRHLPGRTVERRFC